jgi:uncharacterized SAM-binding protein YcdF (DUF218 family)
MSEIPVKLMQDARVLWDYHNIEQKLPEGADFILATGSHDLRVAKTAAELKVQGLAPLLVVSGGAGKVTGGLWGRSEAEAFAEVALDAGVLTSEILIEPEARNTGDNVTKTRDLLDALGVNAHIGVLVTKPYMKRRAFATAAKQWPEVEWTVCSPDLTFDEYPSDDVPIDRMINLMVGDLQRIKVYADQGFQLEQEIPSVVWSAYERLAHSGFDVFMIR